MMVAELWRHGARYATRNIFQEEDIEKNKGMLTAEGMHQQYVLGQSIRKNYKDLFAEKYDHDQIFVESSHVPRCVESGLSHLMGLYDLKSGAELTVTDRRYIVPPYTENTLNNKLLQEIEEEPYALNGGFRTIPIYTLDLKDDFTFMNIDCPNMLKIQKAQLAEIHNY